MTDAIQIQIRPRPEAIAELRKRGAWDRRDWKTIAHVQQNRIERTRNELGALAPEALYEYRAIKKNPPAHLHIPPTTAQLGTVLDLTTESSGRRTTWEAADVGGLVMVTDPDAMELRPGEAALYLLRTRRTNGRAKNPQTFSAGYSVIKALERTATRGPGYAGPISPPERLAMDRLENGEALIEDLETLFSRSEHAGLSWRELFPEWGEYRDREWGLDREHNARPRYSLIEFGILPDATYDGRWHPTIWIDGRWIEADMQGGTRSKRDARTRAKARADQEAIDHSLPTPTELTERQAMARVETELAERKQRRAARVPPKRNANRNHHDGDMADAGATYEAWHEREPEAVTHVDDLPDVIGIYVGRALRIGYRSDKWNDRGTTEDYDHDYTEPGYDAPEVWADRLNLAKAHAIVIVGGNQRITADGID